MSSVIGKLVGIKPTTMEHLESIHRFGGWYWMRESYNGYTRLIPVKDGIPYVSDFIFVPNSDVRRETDQQDSETLRIQQEVRDQEGGSTQR